MTIRLHRLCLFAILMFTTIGCDQVTKTVARDVLPSMGPLTYFGSSVRLQYAENPGAFLSLGADLGETVRFWIFTVTVSVFLLAVAFATLRAQNKVQFIGLTLILAGGIGNLIDRYFFGHVTDFLILSAGPLHTGIFNVADVAITFGVIVLVLPPAAPRFTARTAQIGKRFPGR